MKKSINEILTDAKKAMEESDSYPFLPEIIESIEKISENLDSKHDLRVRMASALERLVTENFSFSESKLGGDLLILADEFTRKKIRIN